MQTGHHIAAQFDPFDQAQRADPYPFYACARRERPVFFAPVFDFWVVTRYADALAVLKNPAVFSSEGAMRGPAQPMPPEVDALLAAGYPDLPLAILTDPPEHSRRHRVVASGLHGDRIRRLAPRIELIADQLIDGFIDTGHADVIECFASPFPLLVLGELMGLESADLPRLRGWVDDWIALFRPSGSVEEMMARGKRVLALQKYLEQAFLERIPSPREDGLSALLRERERDPDNVTMAELVGIPISFFLGGHLTVTRALGSTLVAFAKNQAHTQLVKENWDLLPAAIEEVLRLESPTQAVFRVATRDVRVGEVTIPKGGRLFVHLGSANRDERTFRDPELLDRRKTGRSRHLAFGRGIHFCSGAALARSELQIGMRRLLERLDNFRLDPNGVTQYDPQFQSRGYARLDVVWDAPSDRTRRSWRHAH
jgi:cytochrome P450